MTLLLGEVECAPTPWCDKNFCSLVDPKDTTSITIISDNIMISGKVKAFLNIFESHIIWEKIMRTHNFELA